MLTIIFQGLKCIVSLFVCLLSGAAFLALSTYLEIARVVAGTTSASAVSAKVEALPKMEASQLSALLQRIQTEKTKYEQGEAIQVSLSSQDIVSALWNLPEFKTSGTQRNSLPHIEQGKLAVEFSIPINRAGRPSAFLNGLGILDIRLEKNWIIYLEELQLSGVVISPWLIRLLRKIDLGEILNGRTKDQAFRERCTINLSDDQLVVRCLEKKQP